LISPFFVLIFSASFFSDRSSTISYAWLKHSHGKTLLASGRCFFLFLSVITNFMASSTRQRLIFLEAEDMDEEM